MRSVTKSIKKKNSFVLVLHYLSTLVTVLLNLFP